MHFITRTVGGKEMNTFSKLLAVSLLGISSSVFAQSAFQGFYGQIATGYENNTVSNLNFTDSTGDNESHYASNQSFGGAPLVIGVGYNYSVAPKWLMGIGVDYSAISQKSSPYTQTVCDGGCTVFWGGSTIEVKNRFNVYVAPGYAIDKDKLAYFKVGYSMVNATLNSPTAYSHSGGSGSMTSVSQSNNLNGFILGGGYKQIITGGLYGFAEVNYMSYGKKTYNNGSNTSVSPSLSSYQGLIGIGYKF